jgi:hypothetical protein
MPAVGIVDANAPPASEKLNPAAPSAFTAAALVVRFCFEAFLTRRMIASPQVLGNRSARLRSAKPARKGYPCHKCETSHRCCMHLMTEIET